MKCSNCQQDLQVVSAAQSEYISGKTIRLPFTDIHLTIYHDKPTIQYDCPDCIQDNRMEHDRDIFDAGQEHAYRKMDEQGYN